MIPNPEVSGSGLINTDGSKNLRRNAGKDEIQKTKHRGHGENKERAQREELRA
jgi:hypothetical protein